MQIGTVVIETRTVKSLVDSSVSLAPDAATVRRVLPEEFLGARKYEIGGLIAQGGMGAILDAHEATTQRTVAMKVMLASMSEGDVLRFIEEAQITSQLKHPNIVPVHELGVDEHDQVIYTMNLVQGVTLRLVLEKLRAARCRSWRKVATSGRSARSRGRAPEFTIPGRPRLPQFPAQLGRWRRRAQRALAPRSSATTVPGSGTVWAISSVAALPVVPALKVLAAMVPNG